MPLVWGHAMSLRVLTNDLSDRSCDGVLWRNFLERVFGVTGQCGRFIRLLCIESLEIDSKKDCRRGVQRIRGKFHFVRFLDRGWTEFKSMLDLDSNSHNFFRSFFRKLFWKISDQIMCSVFFFFEEFEVKFSACSWNWILKNDERRIRIIFSSNFSTGFESNYVFCSLIKI